MPAVLPPGWNGMSANEQLLWYLERLCAKAEELSSVLGIASVGDPPMVTSLVDPAASTTTHASSTLIPDVSCSNTHDQEVIHDVSPVCSNTHDQEVIHDVPPAYLFRSMHKMTALRTEHSSKKNLQFMQFGPCELVCYKLQGAISSLFASVVVQTVFSAYTIDSLLPWEFGRCVVQDTVLLHGISCGCVSGDSGYVWWPQDQQPRMKRKLQEWPPPTRYARGNTNLMLTSDRGEVLNHNISSHKADASFVGLKNAPVQTLLRQLLVESAGFGIDMPSRICCGPSLLSTDKFAADVVNDYEEQHVSGDNYTVELDQFVRQTFNKRDPGNNSRLCTVPFPRCMPLLEEIPCELYDTQLHIEGISHIMLFEPYYLLFNFLEFCSVPTYLQVHAVGVPVVHMFQQITSQSWEWHGFFQHKFEPVGPTIVTRCSSLSSSSYSPTTDGIQLGLSEWQPDDWFYDVLLSVCDTYIPEPTLTKFQALNKCDCEHLISTGACNLFMDKGCLRCHMVRKVRDSTMLQTSRIQYVQPRCYFEVGSTQALKLKEVDGAVIYMSKHRNNWEWELLIHFNRSPDTASIWERITGRSFPWDQILLMIFHPWPPTHVTYLMGSVVVAAEQ